MASGRAGCDDLRMPDVTDTAPAPRRRRAVAVAAAAGALVLLGSIGLTLLEDDVADAATVLRDVRNAEVILADGSTVAAIDGEEVPHGATVRTGTAGGVSLQTQGRVVLLGAASAVRVVNGAQQDLRRGLVLVDAGLGGDAPGMLVGGGGGGSSDVTVARGAVARVERGPVALRVGVYEGAVDVSPQDRPARTTVAELFQVQVPYGTLPGAVTPLVLTGDAFEQRVALALLQEDRDLRSLATGLDGAGPAAEAVSTAVQRSVPVTLSLGGALAPTGGPRSEQLLAYLLASVDGTADRDAVVERFRTVRTYRTAGGSWGVVAALVRSGTAEATQVLETLLAGVEVPLGPLPTAAPVVTPTPTASTTTAPTPPVVRPSPSRGTVAPTTPAPTDEPGLVEGLLDTVVGLLPRSGPGTTTGGLPTPTPTPSPRGLLGGLLG